MTRRTSIDVYRKIEADGLLSKRRWEVYQMLFKHGPCTSSELFEHYKAQFKPSFRYNMNVHSRLNELRDRHAAFEVSSNHRCKVSGNRVILWDVTDRLPIEPKKKKPEFKMSIEQAMKDLDEWTAPPKDGDYEAHTNNAMRAMYEYVTAINKQR